jgi:O-antigen/teichoic acid export membrane protein
MRRTLASAFLACALLGILHGCVLLALALTGLVPEFLGVDAQDPSGDQLTASLAVLVGGWIASGLFIGVIHRLLIPLGKLYESTWWLIVVQSLQLLGLVGSALSHLTLLQAAWVYTLLQTSVYLCSAVYVARIAPEYFPWWRRPSYQRARSDLGRSMLLTAVGGIQQATVSGSVLIIANLFGASLVPAFTSVRTLANLWTALAALITNPLQPEIVRFHGTRQPDKLVKVIYALWYFGGVLGNGAMLLFLPAAETLFRIWTGRTLEFDPRLMLGSFAAISLTTFGSPLGVYLAGINAMRPQIITTVSRAILLFGLTFALSDLWGISSIAIAMWAAELLCSLVLTLYFAAAQLARASCRLGAQDALQGIAMLVPLQLTALYGVVRGSVPIGACAVALLAQVALAFWGWRALDPDIKQRVLSLLPARAA